MASIQGGTHRLCISLSAPLEVLENLEDLDDDELYECIEDIWPDYPTKEDFFWDDEEY